MYFDQLRREPGEFMEATCRFLEIELYCTTKVVSAQRVNSSRKGSRGRLPESLTGEFAERVLPQCVDLARQESDAPETWSRDLERVVAQR